MKILMTTDTAGGVWNYSIDLVSGLLEEETEIILLAMGPAPTPAQSGQINKLQKSGLIFRYRPYKLEWMDDPWEEVRQAGLWIKEIYQQEKPHLLHFNNYGQVNLGWEVPVILVAHSCVVSWWQSVKKTPLPDHFMKYYHTVDSAFKAADTVIFPTASLLEDCRNIYGRINNPLVIYNGLHVSRGKFWSESESTFKKPQLFSMGRLWDEGKNVDLLLRAAPYIAGDIFIAGEKDMDLSGPKNVRFLGRLNRDQIFHWLKISGIYVLPVKYEPFGLSFLEAASCRCALVGGDIPSLREIWGESMTYTDPENPQELAQKCNELLRDGHYLRQKKEEAYQKAKKYSLDEKKENYLQVYRNLLVNGHGLTA